MTLITMTGGKVLMKDGKVGTESSCCCGGGCDPCVCSGEDVSLLSTTQLAVRFTAGANAGGRTIGDVCTYCLANHYLLFQLQGQTSVRCDGACNYIDIQLKQNTSGPYAGTVSGGCLSSGLYSIRLYVNVGNRENCVCESGEYCTYELTGWEFLTSDFSDASFIGDITMGNYCA